MDWSRRQVLGGIVGSLMPSEAFSAEKPLIFQDLSPLSPDKLEDEKEQAVARLIDEVWRLPGVKAHVSENYLGGAVDQVEAMAALANESRMYIPDRTEISDMFAKNQKEIQELGSRLRDNSYGLFLSGNTQRLYLVYRNNGTLSVQKAFLISTSALEWSNAADSNGTPLGMHILQDGRRGLLGEVVSATMNHAEDFLPIRTGSKQGETRTFVRGLVSKSDRIAEVITGAFSLVGPSTPLSRGIKLHGTNRTDRLGHPGSGGCIRMSNVDVVSLFGKDENGRAYVDLGSTPLMIVGQPKVAGAGTHEPGRQKLIPRPERLQR